MVSELHKVPTSVPRTGRRIFLSNKQRHFSNKAHIMGKILLRHLGVYIGWLLNASH